MLAGSSSLARHERIDIVRFGNLGPGARPSVLLRFADLAENIPAAHGDTAAYASALWAVLSGADAQARRGQGGLRADSGPGNVPGRAHRAEPSRERQLGNALTALRTSGRRSRPQSGAQCPLPRPAQRHAGHLGR
jgi:hypothetical protein